MEISIIMPVYQAEKWLHRSIRSVLQQKFSNWELILVDDGSLDFSIDICKKYVRLDSRIRLFQKEHSGQADARNVGLKAARGKYIAFLDADDYMHPKMLEQLYKDITLNHAGIAMCQFKTVNQWEKMLDCSYRKPDVISLQMDSMDVKESVCKDNVYLWNKLYDRNLFAGISFPKGRFYEDMAIIHLLFERAERITVNANVLYFYYTNPNGTVHSLAENKIRDCLWAHSQRLEYYFFKGFTVDLNHATHAFLYQAYDLYEECFYKNIGKQDRVRRKIRKKVMDLFETYDLEQCLPLHGKIRYKAFLHYPIVFEGYLILKKPWRYVNVVYHRIMR